MNSLGKINKIHNPIKKVLSIVLCLAMIISFSNLQFPQIAWAEDLSQQPNEPLRAWVCGYGDESTSNFRSSQLLVVKTSGFSAEAELSYHYYSKTYQYDCGVQNSDFSFGGYDVQLDIPLKTGLGALVNPAITAHNLITWDDWKSDSPYFVCGDLGPWDFKVDIVIKDENPLSSTFGQEITLNVDEHLATADLKKDIESVLAMFEGDQAPLCKLLCYSGVVHIYPESEECCTIYSANVENVDPGTVSYSADSYYTSPVIANKAGLASVEMSLAKSKKDFGHPGQSATGKTLLRVFKKPVVTPILDGFDLTNTEAGVTYTIGSQSKKCTSDNQKIEFRGLAYSTDYKIECGVELWNLQRARTYTTGHTLPPYWENIDFLPLPLGAKLPSDVPSRLMVTRNNNTPAIRPEINVPGYVITEWYSDANRNTKFDFTKNITDDFTIYAGKWETLYSSAIVNLTLDNVPYTDRNVELWKNGIKVYDLNESTNGQYEIKDSVENGIYDVYVDGNKSGATINVDSQKSISTISDDDLKARRTGDTFTVNINETNMIIDSYLDDVQCRVDGITCVDEYGVSLTASYIEGTNKVAVYDNDKRNFDIYYNGEDTDVQSLDDPSKNISVKDNKKFLKFYSMTANIISDDPDWVSDSVTLKNPNGRIVGKLAPGIYDSTNKLRPYTLLMLMDEQKSPTTYSIFVNGMDTHKTITATSENHAANIEFFTSDVYISVDDVPKTNAEVLFSNGIDSYTAYKSPDGHYIARLLVTQNNPDYRVSVTGAVDNENIVNQNSKNLNLKYYSVNFMNYETKDNGKNYTIKETPHRSQIVREGKNANNVVDPYLSGASFNYFANVEWTPDEMPVTPWDYEKSINEPTTLYAHYDLANIKINGYVKSDSQGILNPDGDYYTMPNLSISGFGSGKVMKSVVISVTNVSDITYPPLSGATFTTSSGNVRMNAKTTLSDSNIFINFDDKVSMSTVENYLRQIVVHPKTETESSIKIRVSDGQLSSDSEEIVQKECSESWINLSEAITGSYGTLNSGNYFVDKNLSFSGNNADWSVDSNSGITINGNVNIYVPEGFTLTVKGGDGFYNKPGSAGIYLSSGNNLYFYGGGTVNVTGGNAGDGSVGGNAIGPWVDNNIAHTVSGAGGAGGGGAGAGIGTNGSWGAAGPGGIDKWHDFTSIVDGDNGTWGNWGEGSTGSAGDVYYSNTTALYTYGGQIGTSPESWTSNTSHLTHAKMSLYHIGGSGGGGNGAGGRAANNIGLGGGAGGSGGAGGTGAFTNFMIFQAYTIQGGHGGCADSDLHRTEGITNVDGNVPWKKSGDGGYGGHSGSTSGSKSAGLSPDINYTIKFIDDKTGTEVSSSTYFYQNKAIPVPECDPREDKIFFGWKVSTYGKTIDKKESPLTTAESFIYQPGEQIDLEDNTYGNIELLPVFIDADVKIAEDELIIPENEFQEETVYSTYFINTRLDGNKAEIGSIDLVSDDGSSYSLTQNGTEKGSYKLTIPESESKIFKIYVNKKDSGQTVSALSPATVDMNSVSVNVKLDNDFKDIGDLALVKGDVVIPLKNKDMDGETLPGEYTIQDLSSELNGQYKIYKNGEDTGCVVNASGSIEINYYSLNVNITTDGLPTDITDIHLVSADEDSKEIMLHHTDTGFYNIEQLQSSKKYNLFVNNEEVESNITFTEERNIDVDFNTYTVNINKDNAKYNPDEEVYLKHGDEYILLTKVGEGVYSLNMLSKNDIEYNVVIGTRETNIYLSKDILTADVNFYTVTLDATKGILKENSTFIGLENDTMSLSDKIPVCDSGENFIGWFTDQTVGEKVETVVFDSQKTLYAQYEGLCKYKVEYYVQYGLTDTYKIEHTYNAFGEKNTEADVKDLTEEGQPFYGRDLIWQQNLYSDSSHSESTTKLNVAADGSLLIKVYYKNTSVKVEYSVDGHIDPSMTQSLIKGDSILVKRLKNSPEGKTFINWSKYSNSEDNDTYEAGIEYPFSEDTILDANFKNTEELYTLTIDLNGGSYSPALGRETPESPVVFENIDKGTNLNNLGMDGATKEGYVLKYLVDEEHHIIYDTRNNPNDLVLPEYEGWTKIYDVTVNSNMNLKCVWYKTKHLELIESTDSSKLNKERLGIAIEEGFNYKDLGEAAISKFKIQVTDPEKYVFDPNESLIVKYKRTDTGTLQPIEPDNDGVFEINGIWDDIYVQVDTKAYKKIESWITVDDIPQQEAQETQLTPVITVKDGENTLIKDKDYVVSYGENKWTGELNAGSAIINGIGDYRSQYTKAFDIVDTISPTGKIDVDTKYWESFIDAKTFGTFFNNPKDAIINGIDKGSGIAKIQYHVSSTPLEKSEISSETFTDWNDYSEPFSTDESSKSFIYVKITDNAGNISYLSTDGIVTYKNCSDYIDNLKYSKIESGAEHAGENVDTGLSIYENTFQTIKLFSVKDEAETYIKDLTVSTDYIYKDNSLILSAETLESYEVGDYLVKVSVLPLDVTPTDDKYIQKINIPFQIVNASKVSSIEMADNRLTYDGDLHPTLNVGTVSGGKIYYRVGDSGEWIENIPKISDAGEYDIYYKVVGDKYYSNIDEKCVGTFVILQKEIVLKWSNDDLVYNGKEQKPIAAANNLVEGDVCNVAVEGEEIYAGKNYTAVASELDNNNYSIPDDNTWAFSIKEKPLSVNWSDLEFIYDGHEHIPSLKLAGIVDGDDCGFTLAGGMVNAGKNYIAKLVSIDNKNYIVNDNTEVDFNINPKNAIVKAKEASKIEGQTDPILEYTVEGLVDGDELKGIDVTRQAGEQVGEYKIFCTESIKNPNYSLSFNDGVFRILEKPVSPAIIELPSIMEPSSSNNSFIDSNSFNNIENNLNNDGNTSNNNNNNSSSNNNNFAILNLLLMLLGIALGIISFVKKWNKWVINIVLGLSSLLAFILTTQFGLIVFVNSWTWLFVILLLLQGLPYLLKKLFKNSNEEQR